MWDKLKKLLKTDEAPAAASPAPTARAVPQGSTYVPPDESTKKFKVEDFQRPALKAGAAEAITSKAITGFLDAVAPPAARPAGTGPLDALEEEVDGLADIKLDPVKPKRKRRQPLDFLAPSNEPDADGFITIVEEDAAGNQVTRKIKPQVAGEGGAVRLDGEG
jgi:hypothetical protein